VKTPDAEPALKRCASLQNYKFDKVPSAIVIKPEICGVCKTKLKKLIAFLSPRTVPYSALSVKSPEVSMGGGKKKRLERSGN